MNKLGLLFLALAGLPACGDSQGRQTNCWSSGSMSFVETPAAAPDCTDWVRISG